MLDPLLTELVVQPRPARGRLPAVTRKPRKRFAKDLNFSRTLRVFILTWPRSIFCRTVRAASHGSNAQLENEGFWRDYALALVQQAQGDRAAADTALKNFIAKDSNGGAFQIAVLYAIRKEPDEMFKWLDTAYATHDSGLTQLAITPFFFPYRDDPRFVALCQKLNVQLPSAPAKQ